MHVHRSKRAALVAACVWFTLAASGARSEITPEARRVADRFLEASGGKAAFEHTRSTHIVAHIQALGMSGTTESWTRVPNRRATETKLGPFTIQEGFDGKTGWHTDPGSGKPVALDGKDLVDASASAYFDNDRWLASDQGGGKVTLVGTENDSTGAHDVLEVAPPTGRSRRFYVDRKTGLIDRSTSKNDQLDIVGTFSDYRMAGGRKIPFRQITQIVGMPANDLTQMLDSVVVNEPIPDERFAMPSGSVSEVVYLKTPGVARLPFRYTGRHVWLTASVNGGPPVDFLYDTGASITVIDSAFAAKIGLATEGHLSGQGAGSSGSASFAKLQSLRVAGPDGDGVEVRDQKIAVLSINTFLAPFFWRDCAGVIGYDFLNRFVSTIDYDLGTLVLHDPKSFHYEGKGASVPFTLAGTVPVVPMKLDGAYAGDFRVDVGSGSTVDLHGPFVKKNGLDAKVKGGIEVTAGGFGGTFQSRLVRMKSIAIGPYSWKNPLVSFSGAESGALASEDYAGNIGNQILDRFKVTIDYERREIHLEPGRKYGNPDRFSRSGVQLARFGDVVKAMQVVPHSAADRAGLKPGDEVVTIDSKPILSYTPGDLDRMFEESDVGRAVVFEVSRDGKSTKLTLKLADIL